MKKKKYFFVVFLLTISFSFLYMNNVYALPAFNNPECISENDWSTRARSDYQIDSANGKFITSGLTAQELQASNNIEPKYVFYEASADGKTLTAYVNNYKTNIADENIKKILEEAGIPTTENCENILKVTKTMDDDVTNNQNESNTTSSDQNLATDEPVNEVSKIESPNTASPASLLAVSVGAVLVVVSVYVILNKKN